MRFDSIYLVANLAEYDFENVVLLADDVNAIVTELCCTGDGRFSRIDCCEKLLFLGHILETALDVSRRVVKNYDTLEALLRVNWNGDGSTGPSKRKWDFVRDDGERVVNRVARMVLSAEDGERCLGVVKAFYKRFSSKEEFRKVIGEVHRKLVWKKAAGDYLCLSEDAGNKLNALKLIADLQSDDPKIIIRNASRWNLGMVVEMIDCGSIDSRTSSKLLSGILVNIQTENKQFFDAQIKSIRTLMDDKKVLVRYQNLMEFQPFYEVNLELLRTHHRKLQEYELLYDSNTILLCHLIYGKHQSAQFLKDFLNEETLGGSENLELILAELQNFA